MSPLLQKKKHGRGKQADTDLVWGINAVMELVRMRPELVTEIVVAKDTPGKRRDVIVALAGEKGLSVQHHASGLQERGLVHQGIWARISPVPVLSENDLFSLCRKKIDKGAAPFLLVLDMVQDPQNLGAILRSALAAGVDCVVLPRDRSAPLSGAVARSSAGALFHIAVAQATNLSRTLTGLKKQNIWVAGATRSLSAVSCFSADLSGPLCLVVGNEEKGIRPNVLKQCDFQVFIPMQGGLDSLNVAVSASVLLYEAVRQRK